MSYELKSSIKRNRINLPIKITIIVVVFVFIINFLFPTFLSSILTSIIRPIWSIGVSDRPDINLLSLEAQNILISQLVKENIELKALLGRSVENKMILGYILKKPPFTAYDSFILDIGSKDGVENGDKVYSTGNILIGEIAENNFNTSKVKLYSSYGEKYDIFITEKNIQAIAIGRGGGSFEAVVPRDLNIVEGDIVSIPDISNSVFGTVGRVIADPARAFATIIFSQPINIYEQKWVLVSLKKLNEKIK